jgi:hypothetical protein
VDSAKFGNEAHFVCFAAIVATRNGKRLVSICLAKGWLASLPMTARRCSPNIVLKGLPVIKHATSTALDALDEMGGGGRDMV